MRSTELLSGSILLLIVAAFGPAAAAEQVDAVAVFKRASPAVVHVRTRMVLADSNGQIAEKEGSGSGFLVDQSGHIVTNYHVIDNTSALKVITFAGREVEAVLVGAAPALDLALLRAKLPLGDVDSGRTPLELGDSSAVEIGQTVMAIGNALGFQNSLTVGVVSGLARDLPAAPLGLGHAFLQTDAAINPGNSGGPLLNSAGQVVGVNTVVAQDGENVAFAIPSDLVKRVLPDLIRMGHVYQPILGFSGVPITPGMSALFGLSVAEGLLVQEVFPGSPAAAADLRPGERMVPMSGTVYVLGGDVVKAANGKPVAEPRDLTALIMTSKPGDRVRLSIIRGDAMIERTLILPPMHLE